MWYLFEEFIRKGLNIHPALKYHNISIQNWFLLLFFIQLINGRECTWLICSQLHFLKWSTTFHYWFTSMNNCSMVSLREVLHQCLIFHTCTGCIDVLGWKFLGVLNVAMGLLDDAMHNWNTCLIAWWGWKRTTPYGVLDETWWWYSTCFGIRLHSNFLVRQMLELLDLRCLVAVVDCRIDGGLNRLAESKW